MKSIFTLIIVFAFLSVFLTGCAKDEKKSHPKSLDEKKDTDISEGNADGEFPKANGGKSKDTLPEGKIESMFKESVMKIQDIAKPQKFALITDLATFTNSCANIQTPVEAVLHFFNALQIYTSNKNANTVKFLKEILSLSAFISENKLSPRISSLMKRADADLRILWSYIGGVKPDFILTKTDEITVSLFNEKNYQMGQNSWKVWIKSAGKEKHTALLVENLNGRWRVKEFSEVFTKLVEDSN